MARPVFEIFLRVCQLIEIPDVNIFALLSFFGDYVFQFDSVMNSLG